MQLNTFFGLSKGQPDGTTGAFIFYPGSNDPAVVAFNDLFT